MIRDGINQLFWSFECTLSHHLWPLKPLNNTTLHSPISACWSTGLTARVPWCSGELTITHQRAIWGPAFGSKSLELTNTPQYCTLGSCTDHWCWLFSAKAQLQQRVYRSPWRRGIHTTLTLQEQAKFIMWRAESWLGCWGMLLWGMKFVVGLWIKANQNQNSILKFPHKKVLSSSWM